MSRIEKALEKAIQMRGDTKPAPVEARAKETLQPPPPRPSTTVPPNTNVARISETNHLLSTINEPDSLAAEQYRKLKSSLVRITSDDTFHNVIMVTSSIAGEGKSLTATNLAISIAHEFDLTVLLIDADLRRPSIHGYLGIEATAGIADCLIDGTDLSDVIVKTSIDKLSVIPAGREVANPLELFTSKKMQDFIEDIKHRYNDRYVIIDTPPLLPFAETRTLAHMVDGVLLVVREGVTKQESVIETRDLLKGCNILGVVLNDSVSIEAESSHYSTYYYKNRKSPSATDNA